METVKVTHGEGPAVPNLQELAEPRKCEDGEHRDWATAQLRRRSKPRRVIVRRGGDVLRPHQGDAAAAAWCEAERNVGDNQRRLHAYPEQLCAAKEAPENVRNGGLRWIDASHDAERDGVDLHREREKRDEPRSDDGRRRGAI